MGLESAALEVRDDLDLSARFRAELRDATPALAVLAAEDEIPGWLASALPLGGLEIQGALDRRCRLTDVHFRAVQGGPLQASGRVQSEPDSVAGAFLVRLSAIEPVSAGIGFGSTTEMQPFAGESWLQARLRALDAVAREATSGPCPEAPDDDGLEECRISETGR